jgi:Ca-activated chloride channel family protein
VVGKRSWGAVAAKVAVAACLLAAVVAMLMPAGQMAREAARRSSAKTGEAAEKTMAVEHRSFERAEKTEAKQDFDGAPAFAPESTRKTTVANNLSQSGLAYPLLREPIPMESGRRPDSLELGKESPALDTEEYDSIRDNRFLTTAKQPLSTFSIDVDTASYSNVRRFLREGRLPPRDAVRIEEMVNYFRYDYSPPTGNVPFAVDMEVAQCPWRPENRLLRIGVKGREIDRAERGPSNLVFLIDVSGSMADRDKLPLVVEVMKRLVDQLTEDDRVAIVTYADGTALRLPSARGNEKERIKGVLDSLNAGGCTNGGAGIQLAYQQAEEHFVKKGVNRVILCTDGDLNVGVTRDDDLVRLIQQKAKSGVFLSVLGFGTGNLKDGKLEKIADKGNGVYAYIDSLREGQRVLVEQMTGSLITIAKDVKLQVEFNPAAVAAYRLVGYENRVMANRDFHDDRKDAGEIGAGHTVTALYEIVPAGAKHVGDDGETPLKYQRVPQENLTEHAKSGEMLTLRVRYKEPEEDESRLLEFTAKDSDSRFGKASADFRFAAAVAAFGMILRESPHRGRVTLAAVEEFTAGALGKDANGDRAEFVGMVRAARNLMPGR